MLDLLWLLDLDKKRETAVGHDHQILEKIMMFHEPNLKQNMILYFFMNQTLKITSIFSSSSRQSKPGAEDCRPSVAE